MIMKRTELFSYYWNELELPTAALRYASGLPTACIVECTNKTLYSKQIATHFSLTIVTHSHTTVHHPSCKYLCPHNKSGASGLDLPFCTVKYATLATKRKIRVNIAFYWKRRFLSSHRNFVFTIQNHENTSILSVPFDSVILFLLSWIHYLP